jgi:putative phosphoribosyl transferase
MDERYRNRNEAGRVLADLLKRYAGRDDVVVLALPRGGLPVGAEIAQALAVPLDVFVVRKLGVPGHEELAMGAIASGDVRVLNEEVVREMGISEKDIEAVASREREELKRREGEYRGDRKPTELDGRTVILVDDGLATGSTMRAAVQAVKNSNPDRVVVAVPAAAPSVCRRFEAEVDEVVCAMTPEPFYAVGAWYQDFAQLTDRDVRRILEQAAS